MPDTTPTLHSLADRCGAVPANGAAHLPLVHEAFLCAAAAAQYPSEAATERLVVAFEALSIEYRVSFDALERWYEDYLTAVAA